MTSIDADLLGQDIGRHDSVRPAAAARRAPRLRKLFYYLGLTAVTGVFLTATVAAVPLTAVYGFIWLAKL